MSMDSRFVTRVALRNYRSIGSCDVALGSLTFLVGPNGSGKSSFLDALRLVSDALATTLDHALRERGGIDEVRRRSSGRPRNFGIRLDFRLDDGREGWFAFEITPRAPQGFRVAKEECHVGGDFYRVRDGQLVRPPNDVSPPATDDRLYLTNASGLPPFRPVFDLLQAIGVYNLNPDEMRALQKPDSGEILARNGRNVASVLHRLEHAEGGAVKRRIEEYLTRVVPGLVGVARLSYGQMEQLSFSQEVEGARSPMRFPAINMSDGTLRALGILVALFQTRNGRRVPVVAIEEPEVALHPAAAGALRDCLREGSRHTQVLVTSHSPDLLDDPEIDPSSIIAVVSEHGTTRMSTLDDASRSVLRDRLFTAGELLRSNQLAPAPAPANPGQLKLFETEDVE